MVPHETLDARMAAYDLARPRDRQAFLHAMLAGFEDLGRACGWRAAEATPLLAEIVDGLRDDLAAADGCPARADRAGTLHADAAAYLTLGSRMGAAVLRKRVPDDARGRFFDLDPSTETWRRFCSRMADRSGEGADAQGVVDDARAAFTLFIDAERTARLQGWATADA